MPMSPIVSNGGSRNAGTGALAPGWLASMASAMPDRSIDSATIA